MFLKKYSIWKDFAHLDSIILVNHLYVPTNEPLGSHTEQRKQNTNISTHFCTRSKGGSVAIQVFTVTATVYTPRVGFQQGHAFRHCQSEKSAGQMRGEVLMLSFKFLSPAPLTARIDLPLPWIHPGRQQERMHKAHYSEHA